LATALVTNTSPEVVKSFRQRHGLSSKDLDRLFGFSSDGRTTRRWEAEDAPPYVEVMIEYMDKHGIELAEKIAQRRSTS
jgi:antitoxin component HigA of HigAB toxin-antitoxin module